MKTRAITGFFFVLVMVGSVFCGPYVFFGFYLSLSLITLIEFYRLMRTSGIRPHRNLGIFAAALLFLMTSGYHYLQFESKYLLLAVPLIFSIFIVELYKKEKIPFSNIAYTFLGLIYISLPFCFFHGLGFIKDSRVFNFEIPLAFLFMLWANDTGAYLFGVRFGKRKLFERHSPKKSWEGFFGGLVTAMVVAWFISLQFTGLPLIAWLGTALIISSFGTLGDLIESMFKRSLGVKDSGGVLPGHGGLMDRFDGLLLAAPVAYVYLYLLYN